MVKTVSYGLLLILMLSCGMILSAQQDGFPLRWGAQYYDNPYFLEQPVVVRDDDSIGFNWGEDAPVAGVPRDNFSVRWSKGGFLRAGTYRFIVTSDDGFRLRVNNQILLDTWNNPQAGRTLGATIFLEAGEHQIQVDYHDTEGDAYIYLDWGLTPNGQAEPEQATRPFGGVATVTASLLNVRDEPRIANNVITRIGRGQQFDVMRTSDDDLWVKLDLGNNTYGWVSAAYVTIDGSAVNSRRDETLEGLALRSNARLLVRVSPEPDADVIGMVRPNEIVPIIARNRDITWWQVRDGGQIGWVNALFVTVSPDVNPASVVIAE